MIDDFLTSPDDLPPVLPRRAEASARAVPSPAPAAAPRTAIAVGVMLAVSVLGATPAAASPLSKSTPAAERAR